MPEYYITGKAEIFVSFSVQADTIADAKQKAEEIGMSSYVGNGSFSGLVGLSEQQDNMQLSPDEAIEFLEIDGRPWDDDAEDESSDDDDEEPAEAEGACE